MHFALNTIALAIVVFASNVVIAAPAPNPEPAPPHLAVENAACYYKRDMLGDFIGYKRDASNNEVRCGSASA